LPYCFVIFCFSLNPHPFQSAQQRLGDFFADGSPLGHQLDFFGQQIYLPVDQPSRR